jgi:hypothetical protein
MHDKATVELVQRLLAEDLSVQQVVERTGGPRGTIATWRRAGFERPAPRGRHPDVAVCPLRAALDGDAYAYLLGQYLGDGSIATMRNGVYRLGISTCDAYPGIRQECVDALRAVIPTNKVGVYQSVGCANVTMYSNHWPCLLPQHGLGPKHTRPIVLEPWQRQIALDRHAALFVRGLIHSDGCRCMIAWSVMSGMGQRPTSTRDMSSPTSPATFGSSSGRCARSSVSRVARAIARRCP